MNRGMIIARVVPMDGKKDAERRDEQQEYQGAIGKRYGRHGNLPAPEKARQFPANGAEGIAHLAPPVFTAGFGLFAENIEQHEAAGLAAHQVFLDGWIEHDYILT